MIVITIIIVILLGYFWCRLYPERCPYCKTIVDCDDCPTSDVTTETTSTFAEIVIEDHRAASWIVTDNGYLTTDATLGSEDICEVGGKSSVADRHVGKTYPSTKIHGVMYQFGHIIGTDNVENRSFDRIDITTVNTGETYDPDSSSTYTVHPIENKIFDWLDVSAYESPIIDALNAYGQFWNTHVAVDCDAETDTAWDNCLRNRSIHSVRKSDYGLMTYWAGPDSYDMSTSLNVYGYANYTFKLKDPVHADRYLNGCWEEAYDDIIKIDVFLFTDDEPGTGGVPIGDPPTDGSIRYSPTP